MTAIPFVHAESVATIRPIPAHLIVGCFVGKHPAAGLIDLASGPPDSMEHLPATEGLMHGEASTKTGPQVRGAERLSIVIVRRRFGI
jgi:hypothetical protein